MSRAFGRERSTVRAPTHCRTPPAVGRLYGAIGRELARGELGGGLYRSISTIQGLYRSG